ncbi:ERAP1-like C-terminal domain-containing protein [Shewanella sp. UCD-KL12]|uniref:ERAP1-like C-terminal domain-containing protein n=1 Tax=Shewanella sp. UCD-KL12 TaxID=1917163 RepID=UPI0009713FC2|nr:ERAP1-like C-terminal domain-containing protein [Shewanella sp. UCD-KL12]
MNVLRVSLLIFCSLLLISCKSTTQKQPDSKDNASTITNKPFSKAERQQAKTRSERLSDISYQLSLDLSQAGGFQATSIVTFNLSNPEDELTLDLEQANITRFIINGHKIYPRYDSSTFTLSPNLLLSGNNSVEVSYSLNYANDQRVGLTRSIDPLDNSVYISSSPSAHWAKNVFPTFDQPSLKASYNLDVITPKEWVVLSPVKETSVTEQGQFNHWHFSATPKLSPHSYSISAGPFSVLQSNDTQYPLRLISRKSLNLEVENSALFNDISALITEFEAYLGTSYPFAKFDLVLPATQSATSNIRPSEQNTIEQATFAQVTTQRLYTHELTPDERKQLIKAIADDLAAQWFGAMVTENWWDESWLNRSLGELITDRVLAEIGHTSQMQANYYDASKAQAYEEDTLLASYASGTSLTNIGPHKGKTTLIRLAHLIGDKDFKSGVQDYLKRYQYQNASPADFFASQSITAKRSLTQWQQDWLYTPGVNTIEAEFSCEDNRITEFAILQSPASKQVPTLREQKVAVALYTKGRNQLHQVRSIDIDYRGKRTDVTRLIGGRCPDLVYPNYLDLGYVKVSLDKRSLATVKLGLNQLKDNQLRSMLWQTLWENVSAGNLALNEYLGIVFINLPQEKDPQLLAQVIETLYQSKTLLEQMLPSHSSYIQSALKGLEQMSLRKAMVNSANQQVQSVWLNAYIGLAQSPQAKRHLAKLLDERASIKGISLDQVSRWNIIKQLNRYDYLGSRALIAKELKQDKSNSGQDAALTAEVSRPEAGIKRYWLTHIQHDTQLASSRLNIAMSNLYPKEQQRLSAASSELRIESLALLDSHKSHEFMAVYSRYLIPTQCNYAGIATLEKLMSQTQGLSVTTQRELIKLHHNELRCVTIKEQLLK